jgi:hypothetical protein
MVLEKKLLPGVRRYLRRRHLCPEALGVHPVQQIGDAVEIVIEGLAVHVCPVHQLLDGYLVQGLFIYELLYRRRQQLLSVSCHNCLPKNRSISGHLYIVYRIRDIIYFRPIYFKPKIAKILSKPTKKE